MGETIGYWIIALATSAVLGFIPASIAKDKGYENMGAWWFYGWMLFIVALIHSICLENKKTKETRDMAYKKILENGNANDNAKLGTADELMKYKNLLDAGVITQEEFDAKKKQILGL